MAHPAGLYFVCIVKYTVKVDRFQQGTQGFEPYAINIGGAPDLALNYPHEFRACIELEASMWSGENGSTGEAVVPSCPPIERIEARSDADPELAVCARRIRPRNSLGIVKERRLSSKAICITTPSNTI
jgi:hypothetical protein